MEFFTKTKLKNGLRVILVPQKGSLTATVLVLVEAGSEYETKKISGVSHFLEHMCFKGTKNRPKPNMISQELDALGADYNAFTGYQYTGYWAKAQGEKFEQIFDLVSDLYLNPVFDQKEMDKERGVIIEEINMYEDTPRRKVYDVFSEVLYGDQPAGWDIAGTKESVGKLKVPDLIEYRRAHYTASATVVVIAGDFSPKKAMTLIEKTFGTLPRSTKIKKPATHEKQSRPASKLSTKKSDQAHIIVGVRAFDIFDPRRFALEVLSDALGGGMGSRLFDRVRNQLGAAYYVRSYADLTLDHGCLAVASGVDVKRADMVMGVILEEMQRFAREEMNKEELRRVKDHIIGTTILSLESSDEVASFYGGQEIMVGKPELLKKFIASINKVTARDVKKVACDIMKNEGLNLAIVGPYAKDDTFKRKLHFSS